MYSLCLIWRCRLDGSEIEWLCGGGIDNPVELLFLPGGAMIGTMDQTPGDAILHYIDGGWYPSLHDDRVRELPLTRFETEALRAAGVLLPSGPELARRQAERWRRPLRYASQLLLVALNISQMLAISEAKVTGQDFRSTAPRKFLVVVPSWASIHRL